MAGFTRRRVLLGGLAAGAVTATLPVSLARSLTHSGDPHTATMHAYLSTLVPGPGDDPRGAPGAVEAGGLDALQQHAPYVIPTVVADVNVAAFLTHGVPFAALGYPRREALLVEAFADPVRAPYHLIALAIGAGAFYGNFRNHVGGDYIGFPGPSDGYLATFSDGVAHGQPQLRAVPR